LDERNRAWLERREPFSLSFLAEIGRDCSVNDRKTARLHTGTLSQDKSHGHWETEHPLPDANLREDSVYEVRG